MKSKQEEEAKAVIKTHTPKRNKDMNKLFQPERCPKCGGIVNENRQNNSRGFRENSLYKLPL